MYVCEKLKLNKFRDVKIPANKDYFQRLGLTTTPTGEYSGDDSAPMPQTKIQSIEDIEAYDRMKQNEENSKTE